MNLVLASLSPARRAMLEAAQVPFEAMGAGVDEEIAKAAWQNDGLGARDLADALAALKATRISSKRPEAIVLGCDQTLELDDGTMLDKPGDALDGQLRKLAGQTHRLHSAAVACEAGRPVWRAIETVKLTMRPLSDAFIANYVASEQHRVAGCLGGYQIESRGVHLFSRIEGSHFAILGLPLLPLLGWLRERGVIAA